MKIIIVGAEGTIGKSVTASLEKDHDIIKVGRKSGDIHADITNPDSVQSMFKTTGAFDALVNISGTGHWGPLKTMTPENFQKGLNSKLAGQINLVLIGKDYINKKGSFTLTTGILSDDPVLGSANLAAVNGAVNSFVLSASLELENDVRINAISPGVVEDSPEMFSDFPGHIPVSMERVASAYRKSVLGIITGQIIRVW
ncbi:MAG: short chain dehydrogenase [Chryseosolibacter sp.]